MRPSRETRPSREVRRPSWLFDGPCRLPSIPCRLPSIPCRLPSKPCRLLSRPCRLPSVFHSRPIDQWVPASPMPGELHGGSILILSKSSLSAAGGLKDGCTNKPPAARCNSTKPSTFMFRVQTSAATTPLRASWVTMWPSAACHAAPWLSCMIPWTRSMASSMSLIGLSPTLLPASMSDMAHSWDGTPGTSTSSTAASLSRSQFDAARRGSLLPSSASMPGRVVCNGQQPRRRVQLRIWMREIVTGDFLVWYIGMRSHRKQDT